jgi:pimeloyl-ACP methyl ester carboxylesterase
MAGSVLSAYAGKHPEKLVGLVYVDAVGDLSRSAEAREYFRTHDAGMTPDQLQAAFSEMLGPKARPQTRKVVLDAVAKMDPRAFPALRLSMAELPAAQLAARFDGPKFAIEDASNAMLSMAASKLSGVQRRSIADVSHWLMLDDPAAVNALLDEMLHPGGAQALSDGCF